MSTASIQDFKGPVLKRRTGSATPKQTVALQQRARETVCRETGFITNPSFRDPADTQFDRESDFIQVIEHGGSIRVPSESVGEMPGHLARLCETPLLSPDQERSLFRRMNLLKFRANVLRCALNVKAPDVDDLDQIDDLLLRAERIRDHIVQANLRLVISIAKRFADFRNPFDELLSEGISAMMRAVEKFDYDRGFRFSTYTTRAVRRELWRLVERQQKQRQRFSTNATDYLDDSQCTEAPPEAPESDVNELHRALFEVVQRLDTRDQFVVRSRFGLNIEETNMTFVELGEKLGVSKERARQLTERAIEKLRAMAVDFGLETLDLEG